MLMLFIFTLYLLNYEKTGMEEGGEEGILIRNSKIVGVNPNSAYCGFRSFGGWREGYKTLLSITEANPGN